MSLKAFHIVFVTLSTLMSLFFAVWAFGLTADRSGLVTALGVIGVIGVIIMPIYGVYFYKKAKHILL